MFEWFATAVASANAAKEISQSLMTLRDEELVRSRVYDLTSNLMELQQQLMTAQMEQMKLVDRVRTLEAEKAELTKQDDLHAKYRLHQFPDTGSYAYELVPNDFIVMGQQQEPHHYLCCACFEAGQKVILQPRAYGFTCPKCSTFVQTRVA